ncbi:MAG: histidine kinase [Flavobacteriaceae bacterium]|nr:histidine kinase [Flavobacteriaceae bacterium]
MNRLFIHNPLFRLFSPIFSGVVVYLLILLVNNNVEQLQEQFLGNELYFCIGLSLIIQEFSRLLLWVFGKLPSRFSSFIKLIIQVTGSMLLCIILVTVSIYLYYKNILGFTPSSGELWMFNSIFCAITIIYVLLHISHHYLYKVNTKRLENEYLMKQMVEDDFIQFKNGINPTLLFECFEAMIVLIRQNSDKVDNLIDHMALVYRYILSKKSKQLVLIDEELNVVDELVQLFNYLPYRNVEFNRGYQSSFLVVPGSVLALVESIIRSTINNPEKSLSIYLNEDENHLIFNYLKNDKIVSGFKKESMNDIDYRYSIYSNDTIIIEEKQGERTIKIPKLLTKSNS